jgi:hypothetical protein
MPIGVENTGSLVTELRGTLRVVSAEAEDQGNPLTYVVTLSLPPTDATVAARKVVGFATDDRRILRQDSQTRHTPFVGDRGSDLLGEASLLRQEERVVLGRRGRRDPIVNSIIVVILTPQKV